MSKEVTERFVRCIETLKENNKIRSFRQLAQAVGYHPQNMSDIMRGKRDATVELLKNCIEQYNFNPNYLFVGVGNMFIADKDDDLSGHREYSGNIVYVPRPAYAGYADQLHDETFVEDFETFSLPEYKFQRGTYRCFDVEGESMEPSLHTKDKIICSLIDSNNYISSIKNDHVYVIVTGGDVVVKRVMNHIRLKGSIQLISDNKFFKPYELPIREVKEMWKVEIKISPFCSNKPAHMNEFMPELSEIHEKLEENNDKLSDIYKALEKLANQSVYN